MTTTCLQCGAVLPAKVGHCRFCDASFSTDLTPETKSRVSRSGTRGNVAPDYPPEAVWRAELSHRLAAYRARRRRLAPSAAQSELPFERSARDSAPATTIAVNEPSVEPAEDEFAFTIAIGRQAQPEQAPVEDRRMEINVSVPPAAGCVEEPPKASEAHTSLSSLFPVAPLGERHLVALIDVACLLFAYGGFLTLFGSLGGEFTLSKLSAAVYAATLALFYLQYFALFTVFGGTTPGMMLRNLQLVSFSGEAPVPRQLLLRSAGYLLSAGSFFLGFVWAYWDEDQLTWHDRLSRTYLTSGAGVSHADACNMRSA